MSTDKKEPTAKELIDQISTLESVEEVDALVPEGEERTTVLKAAEKRKAELTDSEEEAPETETEEKESSDSGEETPEAETEEKVAVISVAKETFSAAEKAVELALTHEKSLRATSGKPRETEAALIEAQEVFKASPKKVPEEGWAKLKKAVLQHVQYDQQRRGLSTPVPEMKALIEVNEVLTSDK